MDLESAIRIETAEPDSQFRLLTCPDCCGDNVAYVQYMTGIQEPWKVRCFDCGYTVDQQKIFKHEAQACWNKDPRRDKPCMGCADRYPGCSDHCKKMGFLKWREAHNRRREEEQKENHIWGYTAREINRNRRVWK